jgi:hypothetical protein
VDPGQGLPHLWGRLALLSPGGCELDTQFRFGRGAELTLSFELIGRPEELPARVAAAARGADGFYCYALSFTDPAGRARLAEALGSCAAR